jgi:hypothetical protein
MFDHLKNTNCSKELHGVVGHFDVDITTAKILDARFGDQLYSRILMNFVEVVTTIKKMED